MEIWTKHYPSKRDRATEDDIDISRGEISAGREKQIPDQGQGYRHHAVLDEREERPAAGKICH